MEHAVLVKLGCQVRQGCMVNGKQLMYILEELQ
jgi:hypothetical protein